MKKICFLLLALITAPACAGELWQIVSTSVGPDGTARPFTQKKCIAKNALDPSQMLGGLGSCTFDHKNGNASAMTYALTCRTAGMPPELGSMKVAGDATLHGDLFTMRYTITVGGEQSSPGADFSMTGSLKARKIGQCRDWS